MRRAKPPRRPNIKWNDYMRQVLCCLYRFYFRENKIWEEIFSKIFRSHLNERGIYGFIPFSTLVTQWICMRDHGNLVWYDVHIATRFSRNGEWKGIISKIDSTAQQLWLQIRAKSEDNVDTSLWNRLESTPALPICRSTPSVVVSTSPTLNEISPEPQSIPATPQHSTLALPQTAQTTKQQQETEQQQETNHHWASIDSQSDSETMLATFNHSHNESAFPESDESVVTSHGKVCLWCQQGSEFEYQEEPDQDLYDESQANQGYHELSEHHQGQQHPLQVHYYGTENGVQGVTMDERNETLDDDNFAMYETVSNAVSQDGKSENGMDTLPQAEHRLLDFIYRGSDHHFEQTHTRAPQTELIDLTPEGEPNELRLPDFLHRSLGFRLEQTQTGTFEKESIDLTLEDDDWPPDDLYHTTPTPSQRGFPRRS